MRRWCGGFRVNFFFFFVERSIGGSWVGSLIDFVNERDFMFIVFFFFYFWGSSVFKIFDDSRSYFKSGIFFGMVLIKFISNKSMLDLRWKNIVKVEFDRIIGLFFYFCFGVD